MQLSPSAHVDTFARDRLPPPEEWPRLVFDRPELRYPDRLNCGVELLDVSAGRYGEGRPALRGDDGECWSYGELRARVDRIAHVLTGVLGVVPGNRVLLRGPNSLHLAACWLAVMKAGAVAVTVLAAQRAHELRKVCDMGRIGHALCDADSLEELEKAEIPGLSVTPFGGSRPDDLLALCESQPERYEAVPTAADDVAMIAFTSGTTGQPKGCVHFHRDVLAVADTFSAHVLRPTPDDLFAGSPPLGFTFGLGGLVIFPLRAGAAALLGQWSGPEQMLAAVERHRVTVLFTAPTAYRGMLAKLGAAASPSDSLSGSSRARAGAGDTRDRTGRTYDISSLRRCVSAGENLPAATYEAWLRATGLRMINGIGATEMLHIFVSAADEAARPGSTGVAVPGFEARVVRRGQDGHLAPVPDGEPGLLAVRGPVGCRYLADPRQREYVCDGWNLTGDTYIRDPDGYFGYVARADDMIVSAGYNIAGPEVEEALLRHPDVAEAAVVGRSDERRGQVVVAHVVLREGARAAAGAGTDTGPGADTEPGAETGAGADTGAGSDMAAGAVTADALREFVTALLTPYKCPREFVFADSLPRTPTGKLQRYLLREADGTRTPAAGPAPEPAPQTPDGQPAQPA
ncbi:AMP-binding protein [Streptomyces sp. HNM0575]|uniref:AMP-binding protein n=1 Tax=Streptomyces sp. HNM0575 TaxID=2716338 RepID=UPI00145EFB07|nr:AMP-binding protein [Streptomyces sp. HNM0575]NLU73907.1 AMP-binding protein [Streptomyces sp. HNM0575]